MWGYIASRVGNEGTVQINPNWEVLHVKLIGHEAELNKLSDKVVKVSG